ncbi:MAG: hypothetical protein ACRERR_11225 [Moraxellaceae bacterium]
MTEHSPLPPEPVSTATGKTLSLMLAAFLLLIGVISLALIWGYGDLETLLRITVSFLVVALLIGAGMMMARRQ